MMKNVWANALFITAGLGTPAIVAGQVEGSVNAVETEKSHVLGTVQKLFDAMAANDTAAAALTVFDGVSLVGTSETSAGSVTNQMDRAAFFGSIADRSVPMLERMWDATVKIRGGIATVWTPYDFYREREFSHCGIDAVNLVRTNDGWRITSIIWTTEQTGCLPSPLGPPAR